MAAKKKQPVRSVQFTYRKHHIQVLLDKVLFFRFVKNLHGRFWGVTGVSVMLAGFAVCFMIRPELFSASAAFSDFGNDIRTAPYFAGSVFFAAYGMWRWRNYLYRTWQRAMPVTGLITLTVLGLYLIALMPVSWRPIPFYIHNFGVVLVGVSMLATVILDGLLTKTGKRKNAPLGRFMRFVSFVLIVGGGILIAGSTEWIEWFKLTLIGEVMLIAGYFIWLALKTLQGEGNRTILSRILKKVIFID